MRKLPLVAAALALLGLGTQVAAQFPSIAPAVDVNPDPTIVEVFLTASESTWQYLPGTPTTVYAYNGQIPGPQIEANVGDTLIVHFTNNLPEETTIHWHGVETPAQMDGSHIAQLPVAANGGTFDYQFKLLTPSLFWYHPHIKTNEQVEKGLYGPLLVHDPVGEAGLNLPSTERVLMLDDVLLDENNQIMPAIPADPIAKVDTILNGRSGNTILINGKATPVTIGVDDGVPERWRIVDVANVRFFRLSIEEDSALVYRIGGDGGLLETPRLKPKIQVDPEPPPPSGDSGDHLSSGDPNEGIFMVPGARADVVWTPLAATMGPSVQIRNHDWNRGAHQVLQDPMTGNIILGDDLFDGQDPPERIIRVLINGSGATEQYVPPTVLRTIDPILMEDSVGTLQLTMGHTPPPLPPTGEVKLFIQADSMGNPLPTPKINSLNAYDTYVGDTMLWRVTNLTHMDHPWHTHGFFFQPIDIEIQDDEVPENNQIITFDYLENKDTLRLPGRPRPQPFTSRTITRALMKFDDTGREGLVTAEGGIPAADTSAGWLTHCHILEHSANGMLSYFETRYKDASWNLLGMGLAGTTGIPTLRGVGDLVGGGLYTVTLSGAAPGATAGLFIGLSQLAAPFKGGTLVPSPDLLLILPTDGAGEISFQATWPVGITPGTQLWFQYWIQDGGAAQGLAASNAIKGIAQ